MRTRLTPLALLLLFALDGPALASGHSFTANFNGAKATISCDDIDMHFWKNRKGDLVNVRRDQTVSVALSGSTPLRLRSAKYGGIRVQSTSGSSASAVICMAAGARSQAAAEAILDNVEIVNTGSEFTVKGPDEENWGAYLLVSVPKNVSLDLESENGGLDLRGVNGRFTLRTTNGPISITEVTGKVDAQATNGPIDYHGHDGDVRLTADNGPVGVHLDAATWTGKGLDASTQNGPVSLSAPEGLRTGVEVEGSQNSPFQVNGASFGRADYGDWGRNHTVRFGEGPVLVRLSTVNGPVQINGPAKTTRGVVKRAAKGDEI